MSADKPTTPVLSHVEPGPCEHLDGSAAAMLRAASRGPQDDIATLVPCPRCEACATCGGTGMVTASQRAKAQ